MPITLEILSQLIPIRSLEREELEAFAQDRIAEVFQPGSVLFNRGEPGRYLVYLLEGNVLMEVDKQTRYEIASDNTQAHFPLCSGNNYSATATALSEVHVLRISQKIMTWQASKSVRPPPHLIDPADPSIPEAIRSSQFFQIFCQDFRSGELKIPSLPEVANKLRQMLESNAGIEEIIEIILMDPAIAAKLVHVSNSPLYLPAMPVNNCHDAVLRLGLPATRNLITGYCMREIYQSQDDLLKQILHQEWKSSLHLASLCYVLASENTGVDPGEAQLAGLICDIGKVPILHFAENFPRKYWKPEDLQAVLDILHRRVGVYALARWDFPRELTEIPMIIEDWLHNSGPKLALSDIVILAKLLSYIGTPKSYSLPTINSIPAFGKLSGRGQSPSHTLNVLRAAKEKTAHSMSLLQA